MTLMIPRSQAHDDLGTEHPGRENSECKSPKARVTVPTPSLPGANWAWGERLKMRSGKRGHIRKYLLGHKKAFYSKYDEKL